MEWTSFDPRTAEDLDHADPLRAFRDQFFFPQFQGKDAIYMAGNSLGLQPKGVQEAVLDEIDGWRTLGVEGHLHNRRPWVSYHETLQSGLMALTGGREKEVVASGSLTANLHLLMVSFYRPTPQRRKIVIEAKAFPSDRYALTSQIAFHGGDPKTDLLVWQPRPGEDRLHLEDLEDLLEREKETVALLLFGGVNYYTGQVLPIPEITALGHRYGATVGFDLAHAIGNIPLDLHRWNVDFAAWCSYKYLNGGPGAVAGYFVHERFADRPDLPRFLGWWGHEPKTRFQMKDDFLLQEGAGGWMLSNAPILSMAALRPSLTLFQEAGISALREKSLRLTSFLLAGLSSLPPDRLRVITPDLSSERGCQISLRLLRDPEDTIQALQSHGVIFDRRGDVIRLAPAPLYCRFQDLSTILSILHTVL